MSAPLKKILITGAGGMLGSDLAPFLANNFEILGVGRKPAPHLSIPFQTVDLTEPGAAGRVVSRFVPQLIFHCAAMTDVDGCELRPEDALRDNVQGTQSMVQAANDANAMLAFFSTDYVFDGKKSGSYGEEDSPAPLNKYGESKALAEEYIREFSKSYVIFRISWLYGLHGKSFPRTILENGKKKKLLSVVSDQIGCPSYTSDIAAAFRQLLTQDQDALIKMKNNIFHLANEGKTSWAGLAEFILKESGLSDVKVESIKSDSLKRPAERPKNSVLNLEKVKKVLGIQLRPWESAMRDFLKILTKESEKAS